MIRTLTPEEHPSWDDRTRLAVRKLQIRQDEVVNVTRPSDMAGALGRLAAARAEFGSALLALDKQRRPEIYSKRA